MDGPAGQGARHLSAIVRNIILGISLAAPLGPSGVAIIQNGLRAGFWRAFLTAIGVTLADAAYLLLVFFGLSPFLEIEAVRIGLWLLGTVALAYLGIRSLREAREGIEIEGSLPATARNPLLVGFAVNVSNPLAIVWWLGVFGTLLTERASPGSRLAGLLVSSTILIGILAWHSSVSAVTHVGRRLINSRLARLVSTAAGVVLLLFAARFAYLALSTVAGW